ncbi:MAG: recombinase family protein, partial [Oscillospiraceae bacterium]
ITDMCAIYGLIDYNYTLNAKQREKVLRVLSQECEERGTDATGFAYNSRGKLTIFKRPFAAHNVHLKLRDEANVIMGHTRMATQGNKLDNRNNHPFPGTVVNTHFALAHNGVLHNDLTLRAQMKLPNTPIKTDSYIAVQLLEQQKSLDMKSIGEIAELVEGSFVFTVIDDRNNLYFVKGDNPLALYHYEKYGFYVYASTEAIWLMETFNTKGVNLVSLKESIDTTTSTGKLLFTLMSAPAQYERDVLADKTREGLAAARARGRKGGRRPVDKEAVRKAVKLYKTGQYTVSEITELTGVKKTTLYKHLHGQQKTNESAARWVHSLFF